MYATPNKQARRYETPKLRQSHRLAGMRDLIADHPPPHMKCILTTYSMSGVPVKW